MLKGLPELFGECANTALAPDRRGPTSIVIHYLMGDVANAAAHALTHYLPVDLTAPFLQRSSLGTPYQKWARFTNDDFEHVDECVRRLLRVVWVARDAHDETSGKGQRWRWYHTIFEGYHSCVISPDTPLMTLSVIDVERLFGQGPPGPKVIKELQSTFLRTEHVAIVDRALIAPVREAGLTNLERMVAITDELGRGLVRGLGVADVVRRHSGNLSSEHLGRSKNA